MQSYVYFVRKADTRQVKVGRSINPRKRLTALQTNTPERLHLIGALPENERHTEKSLHEKFADQRLGGEWFQETGELESFLYCNSIELEKSRKDFETGMLPVFPPSKEEEIENLKDAIQELNLSRLALIKATETLAAVAKEQIRNPVQRAPSLVSYAYLQNRVDAGEVSIKDMMERGLLPRPLRLQGAKRLWLSSEIDSAIVALAANPEVRGG